MKSVVRTFFNILVEQITDRVEKTTYNNPNSQNAMNLLFSLFEAGDQRMQTIHLDLIFSLIFEVITSYLNAILWLL